MSLLINFIKPSILLGSFYLFSTALPRQLLFKDHFFLLFIYHNKKVLCNRVSFISKALIGEYPYH